MLTVEVTKTNNPKQKTTDASQLGFGKLFTDHMLTVEYSARAGWHDARIRPYESLSLDPATTALHYGQAIFEGLKAYRAKDGRVLLFRPQENMLRMGRSAKRMCMPEIPVEDILTALRQLIELEKSWIPTAPGTSLYIRPTLIGTDPFLGVHASDSYLFFIILSPVGAYYASGLKPVAIYVEDNYVRAVRGGTGFAKAAGNYAASLIGGELAAKKGCAQVLWLDGVERKYVEEVGAMNMFFKIGGKLITPSLSSGSILPGITRDSIIRLAADMGLEVQERLVALDEVIAANRDGTLQEAFGTGTAAVISPVNALVIGDETIQIADGLMGPTTKKLYDTLTGIQYGDLEDPYGWMVEV